MSNRTTILKCRACGNKTAISGRYSGKGYICPACSLKPSHDESKGSSTDLGDPIPEPEYQEAPEDSSTINDEPRQVRRKKGMFR